MTEHTIADERREFYDARRHAHTIPVVYYVMRKVARLDKYRLKVMAIKRAVE